MNSHESRESRFGADESDGDRPADLARRHPSSVPAPPPGDGALPGAPRVANPPNVDLSAGELPAGDAHPACPAAPDVLDDDAGDDTDIDPAVRAASAEADVPFGPNEDDEAAERAARWDAADPRRRNDHFAPPTEPCECHCLHCGRSFSSEGIWFQRVINDPQGFDGFWMCPTANCSGAGFTFDLFPTDPSHPANEGWHYDDDDDEVPEGFEDDDADEDPELAAEEEDDEDGPQFGNDPLGEHSPGDEAEYDPDEPRYKELDALYGEDDEDDLEGEEWKYGLQPGERPANPAADEARREWELEQRRYDEPDQRPRVLDWSDREDRREDRRPGSPSGPFGDEPFGDGPGGDVQFKDDDIPF